MEKKNLTFEEAMQALDIVVNELEAGNLSLDQSVEKFQKGMELSNYCSKLLEEAEKNISILIEQSDGSLKEENFHMDEEEK